jgi:hypothetical protein
LGWTNKRLASKNINEETIIIKDTVFKCVDNVWYFRSITLITVDGGSYKYINLVLLTRAIQSLPSLNISHDISQGFDEQTTPEDNKA